jgi:OOP family OmpA-OmpF porin
LNIFRFNYILTLFRNSPFTGKENTMRKRSVSNVVAFAGAFMFLAVFAGCAGVEYAPKRGIMYYHKELPAADRAVEAARAAGKDKACPAEFQAAEKRKNEAYEIYWSCRTQEAIAKANEATGLANALCPKKAEPPKPAPVAAPPPPPAAPAVSLSANPAAVDAGKCTSLFWTAENASEVSIDQGIGRVEKSGSRQVCPSATTEYTMNATGAGGSKTASTKVTVNPPTPPPPPPAPKVVDQLAVRVNFDTNKATIRKADQGELQKAIDFVKKYPGHAITVEGHTDNVGKDSLNQALSEKRANAVKKHLVDKGATSADKIKAVGYGETRPIADNSTAAGKSQNRRVEIVVFSE